MSVLIIDLNDSNISLYAQNETLTESGYAYIQPEQVLFGADAYAQYKRFPLVCVDNFWLKMNTDSLEIDNQLVANYADLMYLQLQGLLAQITSSQQVILMVPSSLTKQQLSLLIGVLKALEVDVIGLYDRALFWTSDQLEQEQAVFFDLDLHYAHLTFLDKTDEISVRHSYALANKGVIGLEHTIAEWLNQQLIIEFRFDAFHKSEFEQRLYEHIPRLFALSSETYTLEIAEYRLTINYQQLVQKITDFFDSILTQYKISSPLVMPKMWANLFAKTPLHQRYQCIQSDISLAQIEFYKAHAKKHFEQGLFVRQSMPSQSKPSQSMPSQSAVGDDPAKPSASHVLCQSLAYPINGNALYLNADPASPVTDCESKHSFARLHRVGPRLDIFPIIEQALSINQQPISAKQSMALGDEIESRLSKDKFVMIRVEKG
ncbi:hypothetical protein [Thalassotalea aquiviva]|uniref:hypothetical protein n=1 Tax=Thalassotalea aquiviva TaxID=3242415 RepID=UPI00352B961D